jgi:hypothetical protein
METKRRRRQCVEPIPQRVYPAGKHHGADALLDQSNDPLVILRFERVTDRIVDQAVAREPLARAAVQALDRVEGQRLPQPVEQQVRK